MQGDGKGWLLATVGVKDGPLPTHYEPVESPVPNLLYENAQYDPAAKLYERKDNPLNPPQDPRYPYVVTTYRLTEHHTTGAMSRWIPWLSELQPELFCEISPELADRKRRGQRRLGNHLHEPGQHPHPRPRLRPHPGLRLSRARSSTPSACRTIGDRTAW